MPIPADIRIQLADALAELYSDQASARTVARSAGLNLTQIAFDLKASNTWSSILDEAENQGHTQALLDRAKDQYPAHTGLDSACQAYANWVTAGRPDAHSEHPRPSPDTSAGRTAELQNLANILLEPEQENLLIALVEAARNIPREKRQRFIFTQVRGGAFIHHPGFVNQNPPVYEGDVDILSRVDLLVLLHPPNGGVLFDITPLGFRYYEYLKQRLGQPVQRVERSVHGFLNAEVFQRKYPTAYQKWAEAEKILWSADSDQQLTMIGHLCRESIQEFVTALVVQYQPPDVTADKAHTVARMKAVLAMNSERLGATMQPFIDALLAYWGTVIDLIQRQEHGGQKEGQPLVWEDGRRVVFNTAVVMFEIDHALP